MKNKKIYLLFIFSLVFLLNSETKASQIIQFSNLNWNVREGIGDPGGNHWSAKNVFVDSNGSLHLKITKVNGQWYCPEIISVNPLGFGQYWLYFIGNIAALDPNVVFSFYNYPTSEFYHDGTNEIDIEFGKWGNDSALNSHYTVWPPKLALKKTVLDFYFNSLDGNYSTHGFTWSNKKVYFQSGFGHHSDYRYPFMNWSFEPKDFINRIPQKPLPLRINLWLYQGHAPNNNQEIEVIIQRVCFQPADNGPGNCQKPVE